MFTKQYNRVKHKCRMVVLLTAHAQASGVYARSLTTPPCMHRSDSSVF